MRDGRDNNELHVIPQVNNVCEVLQRQLELYGKKDIMLHPEQKERISELISPSRTRTFFSR